MEMSFMEKKCEEEPLKDREEGAYGTESTSTCWSKAFERTKLYPTEGVR